MSQEKPHRNGLPADFNPSEAAVQSLIAKAGGHELGVDFLKTGALESVAAIFETHAFVVDAARQQLNGFEAKLPEVETVASHSVMEINT